MDAMTIHQRRFSYQSHVGQKEKRTGNGSLWPFTATSLCRIVVLRGRTELYITRIRINFPQYSADLALRTKQWEISP